jgi:hypothetical protein
MIKPRQLALLILHPLCMERLPLLQ